MQFYPWPRLRSSARMTALPHVAGAPPRVHPQHPRRPPASPLEAGCRPLPDATMSEHKDPGTAVRNRPPRHQREAHFRLGVGRASGACDRGSRAAARRRRLAEAAAGPFRTRARGRGARLSAAAQRGLLGLRGDGISAAAPGAQTGARIALRRRRGGSSSTSRTRWNRARRVTGNSASSSGSRARPGEGCATATSRGIVRRARAQNFRAPSLDDVDAVQRVLPRLASGPAVCVVFDHNLGGGANQYRRQLIGRAPGRRDRRAPVHVQSAHARLSARRYSGRPAARRSTGFPRSWVSSRFSSRRRSRRFSSTVPYRSTSRSCSRTGSPRCAPRIRRRG